MNGSKPVRLLEERVRCAMGRREHHDLPGVCGDALDRRCRRCERSHPHEEHAIDVAQARVECGRRGQITTDDFNVRRQCGRAWIAGHRANSTTSTAQLRDNLAADLATRAGDENTTHRR
jgi:hypothetical protein